MHAISETPKSWTIEYDEELSELLKDIINTDHPGIFLSIKKQSKKKTLKFYLKF